MRSLMTLLQIYRKSVVEIILKIGQYLAKLRKKIEASGLSLACTCVALNVY